ncbi:hypothetical protein AAE478_010480 [Parahypoxylon ruwenzoriense]
MQPLTLDPTRRDFGSSADPLHVAGVIATSVESTFSFRATMCGDGGPILVLTHGILENKLYVTLNSLYLARSLCPTFEDAEKYSFVNAAHAAGYSVLNYYRIGPVEGHFERGAAE